jgi:hypothetical protein
LTSLIPINYDRERQTKLISKENTMPQYQIVTMNEGTGDWNAPIETFQADNDSDANAYAEAHYQALEWYVINESGANING